jgi:pimeloyl-ACP methyl ester carboxylesterase
MKEGFIQANGIKLHYVEEGEGELVILLHGFPEFWLGWRKQIPVLSKYYRVVAPDMRGYNLSEKPGKVSDYMLSHLAKDIAELIRALGEDKAIVVGHDWGAAVAWAVASLYPEVVKKLAILNVPHPKEMEKAFREFNWAQWKKSWYMFFFQLPFIPEMVVGTENFFRNAFKSMSTVEDTFNEEDVGKYVEAYNQPGARKGAIAYYRAIIPELLASKRDLHYQKIKAPVLMLWGEKDVALGKELTYNTAEHCDSTFEILYDPTSGHFVQRDNPDWVNENLLKFFAQA